MNKYISQEEMIKRKTVNENFTWREKLILKWNITHSMVVNKWILQFCCKKVKNINYSDEKMFQLIHPPLLLHSWINKIASIYHSTLLLKKKNN